MSCAPWNVLAPSRRRTTTTSNSPQRASASPHSRCVSYGPRPRKCDLYATVPGPVPRRAQVSLHAHQDGCSCAETPAGRVVRSGLSRPGPPQQSDKMGVAPSIDAWSFAFSQRLKAAHMPPVSALAYCADRPEQRTAPRVTAKTAGDSDLPRHEARPSGVASCERVRGLSSVRSPQRGPTGCTGPAVTPGQRRMPRASPRAR